MTYILQLNILDFTSSSPGLVPLRCTNMMSAAADLEWAKATINPTRVFIAEIIISQRTQCFAFMCAYFCN